MSDLENVIQQAHAAGLTAVYYTASGMVANGRYTLYTWPGRQPQVICNPAAVAALVAACEAAGIGCGPLQSPARIVLKNTGADSGFVDVYAVPEDKG